MVWWSWTFRGDSALEGTSRLFESCAIPSPELNDVLPYKAQFHSASRDGRKKGDPIGGEWSGRNHDGARLKLVEHAGRADPGERADFGQSQQGSLQI